MPQYLITLLVLVTIVLLWIRRNMYPRPYAGIPYNKHSARRVTGDLPDLIPVVKAKNEFSESLFTITTQRLGTPIAQVLFPRVREPLIILEDPREIEDIMSRRNKEFDKAAMSVELMFPFFPNGTVAQYTTPELRVQKRIWADVMNTNFLKNIVAPNMYTSALELIELWTLKAAFAATDEPSRVDDDFKKATLDSIWIALSAEKAGLIHFEISKLRAQARQSDHMEPARVPIGFSLKDEITYISESIARKARSTFPKWAAIVEICTPRYQRCRRTVAQIVRQTMEPRVQRFQQLEMSILEGFKEDTCMMDLVLRRRILEARKAGRALVNPFKDPTFLDEVFVMFTGGFDTTATALTWFVKYMGAYPDIQTKLRSILGAQFPGHDNPSLEQILGTKIAYLEGVCEETVRLASPVKAQLRQALVDTEVLGYRVPKGAQVFMNLHLNRPPAPVDELRRHLSSQQAAKKIGDGLQSQAGQNLAAFQPERWLVKDNDTGRETFNASAIPMNAFGGGYRGCAGRNFAMTEIRIMVVLLILNFEFLELSGDYASMHCHESMFREANAPYASIKPLRDFGGNQR